MLIVSIITIFSLFHYFFYCTFLSTIICLHTVIWFELFLSNTNNLYIVIWFQGLECSPMARETWVQSQVESYQRLKKMVLDASLLNTQHYKVRIKGKVEQFREGVAPSPTPWCSSYRKGSLRVTLDYGRQLYFTFTIWFQAFLSNKIIIIQEMMWFEIPI